MPLILLRESEARWLSDAPFAEVEHRLRPFEGTTSAVEDAPEAPGALFN